MSFRYCKYCGAPIGEEQNFCNKCGESQDKISEPLLQPEAGNDKPLKSGKALLISVVVFIIAAWAVVAAVLWGNVLYTHSVRIEDKFEPFFEDAEDMDDIDDTDTDAVTANMDFEGTWAGNMTLIELPELEDNKNISEPVKNKLLDLIGAKSSIGLVFKGSKLWAGDEKDAWKVMDTEFNAINFNADLFYGEIMTEKGNAVIVGAITNKEGKTIIEGELTFTDMRFNIMDIRTAAVFSFEAEKKNY